MNKLTPDQAAPLWQIVQQAAARIAA